LIILCFIFLNSNKYVIHTNYKELVLIEVTSEAFR